MQALIIDTEVSRLDRSLIALMEAGVQVTGTGSIRVAETCISRMCVDLLIVEKSTLGDSLGDTIGMAEERNANLVTILRTNDVSGDQDALTPHFPSLHCVVGLDVMNSVALKIGLASLYAMTRSPAMAEDRSAVPAMPQASKLIQRPQTPMYKSPIATRVAAPLPSLAEAV